LRVPSASARRPKAWLWLAIVVAAALLTLGGILWTSDQKAERTLARHAAELREKIERIRARPTARPVLRGDPVPGDGFPALQAAIQAVVALSAEEKVDLGAVSSGEGSAEAFRRLGTRLPGYESLVAGIRDALRFEEVVPPYALEEQPFMTVEVEGWVDTFHLLSALARQSHREGRDREALDLVDTQLLLSADLSRGAPLIPALISGAGEVMAAEAGREVLASHGLRATELDGFVRFLDRLETIRPALGEALEAEDVSLRLLFLRNPPLDLDIPLDLLGGRIPWWKRVGGARRIRAEAVERLARAFRELQGRPQDWERVIEEETGRGNPFVDQLLPAEARGVGNHRQILVWRAMLRAAVGLAAFEAERGAWPATFEEAGLARPRCPISNRPLGLGPGKLWSPGRDGDDDGGRPTPDDDLSDTDGDFVWTIKRR